MKIVYSFICFFFALPLIAQVNTEIFRKSNQPNGFDGTIALSSQLNSGNSNFVNLRSTIRFDFTSDINNTFLVSNYERVSGNNALVSNRGFAHLRTSFPVSSFFDAEAFVQKEFNDFILLKDRQLYGLSGRFCLFNHRSDSISSKTESISRGNLYIGQGAFYEKEFIDVEIDTLTKIFRSTTSLTSTIQLKEYIQFSVSSYFQFDVKRFSDYRILLNSSLQFELLKNLNFIVGVLYRYDNEPPSRSLRPFDFSLTNGISYSF